MLIAAAGDCHGRLDQLYDIVEQMEAGVGRQVDLVIQVGDFGIWPDPENIDRATRKHGDIGDFPRWFSEGRTAPRPTIFIAGNHEDFDFLAGRHTGPILPDLTFLAWGDTTVFEVGKESICIGGVGGCYGPSSYKMPALVGARRRHYRRAELEKLISRRRRRIDIAMFHDAPAGDLINRIPGFHPRTSKSEGLASCLSAIQPRICFTGHWHMRTERVIAGVPTVGLNLMPHPGSVLFIEVTSDRSEPPTRIAEWGMDTLDNDAPRQQSAPPMPPPTEDLLEPMVDQLETWSKAILKGSKLDRQGRKRLYDLLAHRPDRALMLSALSGSNIRATITRTVDDDQWQALLSRWSAGDLPDTSALRRALGFDR